MNLKEFAALKVGDSVQNPASGNGSTGTVVETSAGGVRVVWGARGEREQSFYYSIVTTAWMQWDKVEGVSDGH